MSKELHRWLSPEGVARPLDEGGYAIPEQTQAKLRMDKKIPFCKISKKYIRYDRAELDKWIEGHTVVRAV